MAAPAAGEARFVKIILQAMEARTVQWKLSMALVSLQSKPLFWVAQVFLPDLFIFAAVVL